MILEQAAYYLNDGELLTEAKCDNSIPNAVKWVMNWLARTGRGKDPSSATGNMTRFNNPDYYNRTRQTPNYDALGNNHIQALRQTDETNGTERTNAEYAQLKREYIAQLKAQEQETRSNPHDQTLAESLVESIVIKFSHEIDYEHKGWAKMFIEAFTRIAFTEANFGTNHPDNDKIEQMKKLYLTATMMWKAAKNNFGSEGFRNSFGDDTNMQGITYAKLLAACKGHYQEAKRLWTAEETGYKAAMLRKKAINELIGQHYEPLITAQLHRDALARRTAVTEEERQNRLADIIRHNPADWHPSEEEINAKLAEYTENNVEITTITPVEEAPAEDAAHIPEINTTGPCANLPNPYMENSFRLGTYNVTRIPDYRASHTWEKFQNRTPENDHGTGVSWCLSYGATHWDGYVNSNRTVYFIWKDNFRTLDKANYPEAFGNRANATADTEYGRSLMCIIVGHSNTDPWLFIQCTSRYNHGDGRGLRDSIDKGGDYFLPGRNTVDAGARAIADLMGCTVEQVKTKLCYVAPNRNTGNNTNAVIQERIQKAMDVISRKAFNQRHVGLYIEHIAGGDYNYIVRVSDQHYALIVNNEWVDQTWYKEKPIGLSGNNYHARNTMLWKVKLPSGEYNIVNAIGEYQLPDDYSNISNIFDNRYVRVTIDNNNQNLYDLKSKRFVFKTPVYNIVESGKIDPAAGIAVFKNITDYRHNDVHLVNAKGKDFGSIDGTPTIFSNMPAFTKYFAITIKYDDRDGRTKRCIKFRNADGTINQDRDPIENVENEPILFPDGSVFCFTANRDTMYGIILKPDGTTVRLPPEFNVNRAVYRRHGMPEYICAIPGTTKITFNHLNDRAVVDTAEVDENGCATVVNYYRNQSIDVTGNPSVGKLACINNGHIRLIDLLTNESVLEPNYYVLSRSAHSITNSKLFYFICTDGTTEKFGIANFVTGEVHTTPLPGEIDNAQVLENDNNIFVVIKYISNGRYRFALYNDKVEPIYCSTETNYGYFTSIGHGLFVADVDVDVSNRRSKRIILKSDGELLFNKPFDKLCSAPNKEGYGIVRIGRNDWYYNTLGDLSRNLEQLEESVKGHKSIKHQNLYLESVAYLC